MSDETFARGPEADLAQIEMYRDRLRKMVETRLDPRLRNRLDASDVVQEAMIEAVARFPEYRRQEERMPLLGWLRFLTAQKLVQLRRRHLSTGARDAGREVPLDAELPGESSVVLAEAIAASGLQSPSRIASRAELIETLSRVLEEMDAKERDVILMRHFEQLSNVEIAGILKLSEPAASLRYMKAAQHLVQILRREVGGSVTLTGL